MNDLFQDEQLRNITPAEIKSVIREGRRLRSEEIRRLWGCTSATVRQEMSKFGHALALAGKWIYAKLEAITLRQQQIRVHYD